MLDTLKTLGKVPVVTADVPCFAADDIFCNYCAEAARIVAEGMATPAQVDKIVNDAIGGGGPFNVHGPDARQPAQRALPGADAGGARPAATGSRRPPIFAKQAQHALARPQEPRRPDATTRRWRKKVLDRILAVLLGRTYFVVDNEHLRPGASSTG